MAPPLVLVHGALSDHTTFAYEIIGATDEEVELMRSSPMWPTRLANAWTLPRELRSEGNWVYRPGQLDGVTATTLILEGSESRRVQHEADRLARAAATDREVVSPGEQVPADRALRHRYVGRR